MICALEIILDICFFHAASRWQGLSVATRRRTNTFTLLACDQVFKEYFKELEEESIRDNFVTVYELMDEVMDFGFPQTTDSKILQE